VTTPVRQQPVVELNRVSKSFGNIKAVDDISLQIFGGEFFSLLGPSGCGKTTTLRLLAGLEQPDATGGEVRLLGNPVNQQRPYERQVSMVFQNYALFPHLTVDRNVAFGLEQLNLPASQIRERVSRALAMVRLDPGASPWRGRWSWTDPSSSWMSRWAQSTCSCGRRCSWS
jgi:ABC-type Fe3+/spermidine/putrescine transport system ATPase subunit